MEEVVRFKELRVRIPADLHAVLREISEKTGIPISKIIEYALDQYVLSIIKEKLPLELKVSYIIRKIFDISQLQQRIDIAASVGKTQPVVRNEDIAPIVYELQKIKDKLYSELIETAREIEDRIQKDMSEVQEFTRFVEKIQQREWRMREKTSEMVTMVVDVVKRKEELEKEKKEEASK
ncbi:MAG: ribbon-helix-helix domain-containing protein [Thaumarchaeota archaeon]|nr:ribbon-helix-helix domain-containing protein [Candidatus Geocrenenecus arthurdayi]